MLYQRRPPGLCRKAVISATLPPAKFQEDHDMSEHLSKTSPVNTIPLPEASVAPPPQEERKAALSRTRVVLAFLVAGASDIVSYGTIFAPPVQWAVDIVTAFILF